MSVYPERRKGRLTGKWIAETAVRGSRVRKRFDTKRDGDSWEDHMRLGMPLEPAHTGPTLGQVTKEFLAANPKDADPSGLGRLMFILDEFGADTELSAIDEPRLDKFVKALKKRPGKKTTALSPATINRYLSAVSAVFHFARVRKYVPTAPAIPWQAEDGKRLDWLPEDKEQSLLGHMLEAGETACALIVRVLIATGMRWGELASLTPEQVEPATGWIRLWVTKNKKARSAPVPPALARELKTLIEGSGIPKYATFRKCLRAAAKSAGLPPSFSIHALRHTTATRLLKKNVPLAIVQKYLGHKTIQTTLKYTHVADDDLQKALEKISPHAGETPEMELLD